MKWGKRIGLVVALASFACVAAPASAGVLGKAGGFTYVKAAKKVPASGGLSAEAEVTTKCPRKMVSTGVGASMASSPKRSFVADLLAGGKATIATGWNFGSPKSELTGWAICTPKLNAVDTSILSVETNDIGQYGGVMGCPSGNAITSGGPTYVETTDFYTHGGYPVDGPDGDTVADRWVAQVWHLIDQNDIFINHVVCMSGGNPQYPIAQFASVDPTTATAKCPAGTSVVGGGFFSPKDTGGNASVATTKPVDLKDKDKVPDDGWRVEMNDPDQPTMIAAAVASCR